MIERNANAVGFGFIRTHLSDHNIQIDDLPKIVHKYCATVMVDIGTWSSINYNRFIEFLTNEINANLTKKQVNIYSKYIQSIEVECPDCNCKSVAYDSYDVVSLPAPTRY